MDAIRPHRLRRAAAVAVSVAALGLVAGCGGSSDDAADEPTTTAPADEATTTAAEEATTTTAAETTTTEAEATGGDLEGAWVADAGDIIGANTANLGGVAVECSGPITLEFTADAFTQSGEATCSIAGQSGTATFASTGSYEVADGTITVSGASGSTTFTILGQTQEQPGGLADGEATYAIDGDTLSITFTVPAVGTVTQTYTRS